MPRSHEVLVVGAGIVGSACALALRQAGLDVALVDAAQPGGGVTAAGMGHLVALDECDAELDLCLLSLRLWRTFFDEHPGIGQPAHCGTLWVARNEHELADAYERGEKLAARGYSADALGPAELARCEPALRAGLCGALRVQGDSVVYPPAVAAFLAGELRTRGGTLYLGQAVQRLETRGVLLADGTRLAVDHIVVAAGVTAPALIQGLPVFARKGHLAITDRYPGTLRHQVVSMAYGQGEGWADALAVAANVQPRSTGQWLVGSCRQDGQTDTCVDPTVLAKVLTAAIDLLPGLARMNVIRSWTGMRPATPDGLPLIGAHPAREGVWLACGHEGLGVTTAFGTAQLLADQLLGRASAIEAAPYAPSRFASLREAAHA